MDNYFENKTPKNIHVVHNIQSTPGLEASTDTKLMKRLGAYYDGEIYLFADEISRIPKKHTGVKYVLNHELGHWLKDKDPVYSEIFKSVGYEYNKVLLNPKHENHATAKKIQDTYSDLLDE